MQFKLFQIAAKNVTEASIVRLTLLTTTFIRVLIGMLHDRLFVTQIILLSQRESAVCQLVTEHVLLAVGFISGFQLCFVHS